MLRAMNVRAEQKTRGFSKTSAKLTRINGGYYFDPTGGGGSYLVANTETGISIMLTREAFDRLYIMGDTPDNLGLFEVIEKEQ